MPFASALMYDEVGCGIRPRHPIVCMLDLAGLGITLALVAVYPQRLIVTILPLAIAALYVVSCAYHWLPACTVRQRLDHMMIAVVIAITYVPYWAAMLPLQDALPRYFVVGVMLTLVCIIKWLRIEWQKTGGALLLAFAVFGSAISYPEFREHLPPAGFWCFWTGAFLYLVQFAVYTAKRPDPWPAQFGFREIQHFVLVAGTTLQTFVALNYL